MRFLEVGLESTECSYENCLTLLSNEISIEEALISTVDHLLADINSWKHRIATVDDVDDLSERLSILQLIESDLIPIDAQISLLQTQCAAALTNRKYVLCSIDQIDDLQVDITAIRQCVEQMISNLLAEIGIAAARAPTPLSDVEYDLDAAADVLAAVYPHQDPMQVLREQGFIDDIAASKELSVDNGRDLIDAAAAPSSSLISPIPDDPTTIVDKKRKATTTASDDENTDDDESVDEDDQQQRYVQRRSRWRRVLRTALPLQAMLVLLLGAACLVPHCDDEYCCQLLNNFAHSFEPMLEHAGGQPPF